MKNGPEKRLIYDQTVNYYLMNEKRFDSNHKQIEILQYSTFYSSYSRNDDVNHTFKSLSNFTLHTLDRKASKKYAISTPESLKETVINFLDQKDSKVFKVLSRAFKQWISSEWDEKRSSISSRLNKLRYLVPSLGNQKYQKVEKEIILQWRKNQILKEVQFLWNYALRSKQIIKKINLRDAYNQYREFVSKICWIMFHHPLNQLQKQGFNVSNLLFTQTSIIIVTNCFQWIKHTAQLIKLSFCQEISTFSDTFNLSILGLKSNILDVQKHGQLPKTAAILQNLILFSRYQQIIVGLEQFRLTFIHELQTKFKGQCVTLQKDDLIGCICYMLVHYKLDHFGIILRFIQFLFGQQIHETLSKRKVSSFKTDLDAAYEFVSTFNMQKQNSPKRKQIQISM